MDIRGANWTVCRNHGGGGGDDDEDEDEDEDDDTGQPGTT